MSIPRANEEPPERDLEPVPLAPDEHGLCYVDEAHFDEAMARVARAHLAARNGILEGRLTHGVLWAMGFATLATCAGLGMQAGLVVLALTGVVAFMTMGQETRQARRIETEQLCFACAYPLHHLEALEPDVLDATGDFVGPASPDDDPGRGRCPECGASFHVAHYRRPPPQYARRRRGPSDGR